MIALVLNFPLQLFCAPRTGGVNGIKTIGRDKELELRVIGIRVFRSPHFRAANRRNGYEFKFTNDEKRGTRKCRPQSITGEPIELVVFNNCANELMWFRER